MPLLNSFYAWLLALAAYGTIDFNDYILLETNDKGFSFYLSESDNYVIEETIANHLRAHGAEHGGMEGIYGEPFVFGIKSAKGAIIAAIAGIIITGTYQGSMIDPFCFIGRIWVDEAYRHQKLGTFLIGQVQNYAHQQGCAKIQLDTDEIDQTHNLFQKMGFEDVAIAPSPKNLPGHEYYWMRKNIHNNQMPVINISEKGYEMYQGHPLVDDNLWSLFQSNQLFDFHRVKRTLTDSLTSLVWTNEAQQYIEFMRKNLKKYRISQGAAHSKNEFTIFIVSPDKKIIGGAFGDVESFKNFGNFLKIHDVAIDANYRKHSLGRELFKHVDAYARSKHCKYLELGSGESEAPIFYEKVGFTREVTLPASFNPNNDAGNLLRKYLE